MELRCTSFRFRVHCRLAPDQSVGLQLQSCEGVRRRSPPKWRTVFDISTPFEGIREGVQKALVDGLILGRQAAWRPGTIVVVSSCDQ